MEKKLPTQAFKHSDVEILNTETAYQGYFKMLRYELRHRLFAGGWSDAFIREVFTRGAAVGLLPYDPALDCIVMLEQFRIGAMGSPDSPWQLEIVAGMIEENETPEDVAIRESQEEADLTLQAIKPMHQYWASPGGGTEYMYLFCGKVDSSQAGGIHGLADEQEDIKVHVVSREAAIEALQQGRITNAFSIIAIQWLALNYQSLQAEWGL